MKKHFLSFLFMIFSLSGFAQKDNLIVIGKVDSVYSQILKEQRKVWVYVPNMNAGQPASDQRYPVVYLLDGDAHFESVVGMIQQLSQVNGNTVVPEMIVVGIPNTDRTRDLTPTHITSDPPIMDSNFSKNTGGGENFTSFIEKELMPHIDSAYPTAPFKMLIGHSFGGLTVMNILTNQTALFNAYIAIDPSMWYDQERFLKATEQKLSKQKFNGTSLYLGIANTMPEGMTLEKMKKDTTAITRHIRSIFALNQYIKAHPQNGLQYASRYYADDDHGSVPLATEYDGLRFLFKWYRMKLTPDDFMAPGLGIVKKMQQHYQDVSKHFGYKVLPPEMQINGLGYNALSLKQYPKAAALFEMNIANYPNSGNVYDSYADLLLARKDTQQAIVNYKKALALTQSAETQYKLDQLTGKALYTLSPEALEKYAAVFTFDDYALTATTFVKDKALWATVPGQDDSELVPVSADTFTVKGKKGYTVVFEMKEGRAIGFTATQPNGIFKAHVK
ncbi:MAG: alpha/beta hydrolase [Terrimonas sp.]|nr:alpha/beta hydrolase [Terrimonas sp.]